MYINEASFYTEQDSYMIKSCMAEFFKLYEKLYNLGVKDFYTTQNIKLLPQEYPMSKWIYKLDVDERRIVVMLLDKIEEKDINEFSEYDAIIDEISCSGLLGAYLESDNVISLNSNSKWAKDRLEFEIISLHEKGDEVIESKGNVQNFYSCEQDLSEYENYLMKDKYKVYTYEELWSKKEIMFPHLEFCPSVRRNLLSLDKKPIRQILNKLKYLDKCAGKLEENPLGFSDSNTITIESQSTLNKYRSEHTFRDKDGKSYLASWHARFTGIAGRIYFVPVMESSTILICHIGGKLPNVTYPT